MYEISLGIEFINQMFHEKIKDQQMNLKLLMAHRLRTYIQNSYENLINMYALSPQEKHKIQDISESLQQTEQELICTFTSHVNDYILSILPAQIQLSITKFIDEDKEGGHGKKWRVSLKQFQKDLSLFLYKRIRDNFEVNIFQH
mmetsp:Transcript_4120/g.3991  ORF Transcript_4120/g.3991 Transcript_4120/m.3991 type:complete len:144 (+) Transcript_4120:1099-1530(+)